jgi:predicted O-methyltransferase YrrM
MSAFGRVLTRLEEEDAPSASRASPRERSRAVEPHDRRFLFSLVAPQTDCEVLEIGGSRGYSTIWLAAGVRNLGGRVLSVEHDPRKIEAWREHRRGRARGLADLVEGDAKEAVPAIDDVFDVVFLDAEKDDYEELFRLARTKLEPGALVVADNVLSHRRRSARTRRRGRRPDARVRDRPARPRPRAVRDAPGRLIILG